MALSLLVRVVVALALSRVAGKVHEVWAVVALPGSSGCVLGAAFLHSGSGTTRWFIVGAHTAAK